MAPAAWRYFDRTNNENGDGHEQGRSIYRAIVQRRAVKKLRGCRRGAVVSGVRQWTKLKYDSWWQQLLSFSGNCTDQRNHNHNREDFFFLFLVRGRGAYFVNGANAAASTASTLIRRCPEDKAKHSQLISRRPPNSHRVFIQVCIKRETTPELSTDWVDPWVGSRFFSFWWVGLGPLWQKY